MGCKEGWNKKGLEIKKHLGWERYSMKETKDLSECKINIQSPKA